jgi:cytidine deaminase
MARRLGIEKQMLYPFVHAESDMVGKLIGMGKLSSSLNIVVLRLNKFGELRESKPCASCTEMLEAYGLSRVWYSTSDGGIEWLHQRK